MPEAEIDAEVGERRPGDERRGRKNELVVGRENCRQEDRENARDPKQDPVKERRVPLPFPEIGGRHEIKSRDGGRGEFDDEGNSRARLDRNAVDVEIIVIFIPLGAEAERRRDIRYSGRIEVWLGDARSDDVVTLGCQEAEDGLVSRVAEREDHPARVRSRRFGRDGHAPGDAVCVGCGFDAELVAAPLVKLAKKRDIDLFVVGTDDNRLHGPRRRSH